MPHFITCPCCHASLKANKLPSGTKIVACPECKQSFQVASTGITSATPEPRIAAPANREAAELPAFTHPTSHHGLLVGLVGSILLVGAGIIAAIFYTRQEPQPAPAPTPAVIAKDKETEETPKTDDKEQDKRRQEFTRLMIKGGVSLIGQQFDEAVSAYTEAATLFPDDAEAKQKLGEAQTALLQQRQQKLDEDKLRDDAVQLAKQGQSALQDKKYTSAIEFFKLALAKNSSLNEASQGLIAAQSARERDQLDQKKIDEYTQFLEAGKAAQKAGRYADAVRDFIAAGRVVPNDAIAMQFQREAEKQLDGLMDRAEKMKEFQRLVDQANVSLRAKNYDEADKTFQRALRLYPTDATALKGQEAAQKALKSAKNEYAVWMVRGNAAAQAGRFADAALAFQEATRLLPGDETALKALRAAELAQNNQNAYLRAMEQGSLAMTARQYPNAIVAYNEALRAAPGDTAALLGLQDAQRAFEGDALRRKDFERRAFAGLQALKTQRYADAASDFRSALKAMPRHPDSDTVRRQLNYAESMDKAVNALNARRFNDAITHFLAALDIFPNDFAANNWLRTARQKNKNVKS